jgi:protein-tyrosine phosphatase
MTQITERIFIGDADDQPFSQLSAVLNVATDLRVRVWQEAEYVQVGLIDGPGNLPGAILAAVLMLNQLLQRHKQVIVICHGGRGRSGLIVALYLCTRFDAKFESTLDIVRQNRPEAMPSQFLRKEGEQVVEMLRTLFKQGY